jgi:hypothetical protein
MNAMTPDDFPDDDAAGITDAELRTLREQARTTEDAPLRRLLASYITLRTMTAEMVTFIEAREGAQTVTRSTLFSRLKELTRRAR